MEHLGGGGTVDIVPLEEVLDHIGVVRHMRQHPQFNLGIVGVDQDTAFFCHKEPAQLAPISVRTGIFWRLGSVELMRPGAGFGLVKPGMDAAVGTDLFDQAVAVGGFQFGEGTVLQNFLDNRVIVPQAFQHLCIGGIPRFGFLPCAQAQFVKQGFAKLLGGIQVKGIPHVFIDPILKAFYLVSQRFAVLRNAVRIHRKPQGFHPCQDVGQRDFYLMQQGLLVIL